MKIQRCNFGKDRAFGYQLHEECYNFSLHVHQFVELVLVLEGELSVSVSGREYECAKAGEFILVFPFQTHKYTSAAVSKFVIYTFSPSLIADFIESVKGRVGDRSVFSADRSTYELFFARLLSDKADFSFYSIRSCLYAMLSDFCASVELSENLSDSTVLEKMVMYMNENYTSDIPLVKVAKEIGYSSNYLSHIIKKSFSFGYPTLLACIRIEHAKKEILDSKRTSLEISLECGFGSERNFNRQFKHITGMTPKSYKISTDMTVVNKAATPDWESYGSPVFSIPEQKKNT